MNASPSSAVPQVAQAIGDTATAPVAEVEHEKNPKPADEAVPANAAAARALIDEGQRAPVCLVKPSGGVGLRSRGPSLRIDPLVQFSDQVADYNQLRFKVEAGKASVDETLEFVRRRRVMSKPHNQAQLRQLLGRFEHLRFKVLDKLATSVERRELGRVDRALSNPYRYEQEVARLVPFSDDFAGEIHDAELAKIDSRDVGHNVRVAMLEEADNKHRFMSENVLAYREAYALDGVVRNIFWTHTTRDGQRVSSQREYYDAIYQSYKTKLRGKLTASIQGVNGRPFIPLPDDIVDAAKRNTARQKAIADSYVLPQDRPAIQREVARRRAAIEGK